MLFTELIIKNYKIFNGFNKIVFSTDNNKPYTIIKGVGASGKTTISDALVWCLYGKQLHSDQYFDDTLLLNSITQKHMIDEEPVFVELKYKDYTGLHSLKRSITLSMDEKLHISNEIKTINRTYFVDNKCVDSHEYNSKISRIFPQHLSSNFWHDFANIHYRFEDTIFKKYPFINTDMKNQVANKICERITDYYRKFSCSNDKIIWDKEILIKKDTAELINSKSITTREKYFLNIAFALQMNSDFTNSNNDHLPLIIDDIFHKDYPISYFELFDDYCPKQAILILHSCEYLNLTSDFINKVGMVYQLQKSNDGYCANIELVQQNVCS